LLLDVTDRESDVVSVGAHGHILVSEDNGFTWEQGRVPVTTTLTAVDFYGVDKGWAVGHDGVILNSVDGGKSWVKQFDGFKANEAMLVSARNNLNIAEERAQAVEGSESDLEVDQAMMALENAEFAFQDAEYDLETGSTKPFLDVYFWSAKDGIAVGAYGMAFQTMDGGEEWFEISSRLPNPNRLHLNTITRVGDYSLTIVGEMGLMLRSDDMGETWNSQVAPYDGSLFGLIDEGNTQILFALRGHTYRSTDDGITWTALDTGVEQTLLGGFSSERGAMLVGNGGSVVTLNAQLEAPENATITGRTGAAAVLRSEAGHYIIAGEAGIQLVDREGKLLQQQAEMNGEKGNE
jgi:photosystem II stability/assembly factor-like uncharacterized protein